jgi:hypothetical protein
MKMTDEEKKKHLSQLISGGLGESAKNVSDSNADPELQPLLRQWQLPKNSPDLDRKVLTAYRNQVARDGGWKRLFLRSIPVPLPIAAALLLAVSLVGLLSLRPPAIVRLEVPGAVPQVVRVEVPVVREKVVTRTVYRQSSDRKTRDKHLESDTHRSTVDGVSRGSQRSQIAVQLGDFEPVEKIQLKILKGVDQ